MEQIEGTGVHSCDSSCVLSTYQLQEDLRETIRFFFQAEDGIRDIGVTGVQTCALPIFLIGGVQAAQNIESDEKAGESAGQHPAEDRSEERRVGKECKSRGSARS